MFYICKPQSIKTATTKKTPLNKPVGPSGVEAANNPLPEKLQDNLITVYEILQDINQNIHSIDGKTTNMLKLLQTVGENLQSLDKKLLTLIKEATPNVTKNSSSEPTNKPIQTDSSQGDQIKEMEKQIHNIYKSIESFTQELQQCTKEITLLQQITSTLKTQFNTMAKNHNISSMEIYNNLVKRIEILETTLSNLSYDAKLTRELRNLSNKLLLITSTQEKQINMLQNILKCNHYFLKNSANPILVSA